MRPTRKTDQPSFRPAAARGSARAALLIALAVMTLLAATAAGLWALLTNAGPHSERTPATLPDAEAPGSGFSPGSEAVLIEVGRDAYGRFGCFACHSLDGTPMSAATFKGLYGTTIRLESGRDQIIDDAFIRESILSPSTELRAGASDMMPPQTGRITDRQLEGLIALIRSLADDPSHTDPTEPEPATAPR